MIGRIRGFARSNAIALLALFVALGGTSYAAVSLEKDSVGAKQIKAGAVRSSEVKDKSLLAKDFKPGQLPAGAKGDTGATGAKGDTGATGAAGTARAYGETVNGTFALNPARSKGVTMTHPSTGIFCITATGIDRNTTTLVATGDFANAGTSQTDAQVRSTSVDCPAGTFEVMVRDNGTLYDAQFAFVIP